ncbi:MAG: TrbG/VirB9 family P-type conjugative transfer protein [Synergistaceae bacterium]|jgi:type IV secretion system protein VirB9|nr:TrbG/VirB9 family P-type conjugative transfer protein [Synergistaceae bacterium]
MKRQMKKQKPLLLSLGLLFVLLTGPLYSAEGAVITETGPREEQEAVTEITSADILSHVGSIMGTPLEFADELLPGITEGVSGGNVVLEDDPDSAALSEKLKILDRPPGLRTIDDAAVNLARAYDEAKGAPMPYIQENGRINFYFGTLNPRIVCKPLRLTDIELQPGESVRNVHISDTSRWIVSGAQSGADDALTAHVIVKPQIPDIAANMLIHTDRRTYSVELVSVTDGQFMPFVGFIYPEVPGGVKASDAESWQKLLAAYRRADDIIAAPPAAEVAAAKLGARGIDPADVYTKYSVKIIKGKNISWKPLTVYDAKGHTYVVMPELMQVTESPAFFIKENGREKLTNYRVDGNTYIVDRLFDIGILQIGGNRVAIYRGDKVAASAPK